MKITQDLIECLDKNKITLDSSYTEFSEILEQYEFENNIEFEEEEVIDLMFEYQKIIRKRQ
jgi:hypothetical protein